jgi:protein TonB
MNLKSAVVFRKRFFLTPIVMNDRRRFSLALILALCFNLLLLAAGEIYFRFSKQDLQIENTTAFIVQVVLGKSIQEEIVLEEEQSVLQNQFSNEEIIAPQQIVEEFTKPFIDQENILIDPFGDDFAEDNFSASGSLSEIITDNDLISSPETIADNNISPSLESANEAERNKLSEMIYALIEKEKQYPALARRRNIEGQVNIIIQVSVDGKLEDSIISSSSNSSILDQAAINLVQNIFPLDIILQSETEIEITIRYSLKD